MNDGIYNNITIEDYHANKTHLSSTQIKLAKKSLKELHWTLEGKIEREDKTCFDFGNAFELALLDHKSFSEKVAIVKDSEWVRLALQSNGDLQKPRSSKIYQDNYREFLIGRQGMYKINDFGPESYDTIQHMIESCYADKIIQALIKHTEYQLSIFWTDPETGLKLKTRPDICKRKSNVIVNVKTAEDGSPKGFAKDLVKYDYPIQACHEITGCLKSGLMDTVDNYYWLVVEKKPPFNATIYNFDEDDISQTMDELRYLYNKISQAEKENLYPGYSDRADNQHGILRAPIPLYYRTV